MFLLIEFIDHNVSDKIYKYINYRPASIITIMKKHQIKNIKVSFMSFIILYMYIYLFCLVSRVYAYVVR